MDTSLFDEAILKEFTLSFKTIEVPAKTILLREGEISKKAFFIESGCLRVWFNNNGKECTTQFFFDREMVSSIESFRTGAPGLFNIESIEPCVIKVITKAELDKIEQNSPIFRKRMEETILKRLFVYQKLFLSRIKDSPEKRYHDLLENNPEMILRIPQHYIASYLGITSVSLSRIRRRG